MADLPHDVLLQLSEPVARGELAVGCRERAIESAEHLVAALADRGEGCIEHRGLAIAVEEPSGRGREANGAGRPQDTEARLDDQDERLLARPQAGLSALRWNASGLYFLVQHDLVRGANDEAEPGRNY